MVKKGVQKWLSSIVGRGCKLNTKEEASGSLTCFYLRYERGGGKGQKADKGCDDGLSPVHYAAYPYAPSSALESCCHRQLGGCVKLIVHHECVVVFIIRSLCVWNCSYS